MKGGKNHAENERGNQRLAQHIQQNTAKTLHKTALTAGMRFRNRKKHRYEQNILYQRIKRKINPGITADNTEQQRITDKSTIRKCLPDCRHRRAAQILTEQTRNHQANHKTQKSRRRITKQISGNKNLIQPLLRQRLENQGGQSNTDNKTAESSQPFQRKSPGARRRITKSNNNKNRQKRRNNIKHDRTVVVENRPILRPRAQSRKIPASPPSPTRLPCTASSKAPTTLPCSPATSRTTTTTAAPTRWAIPRSSCRPCQWATSSSRASPASAASPPASPCASGTTTNGCSSSASPAKAAAAARHR